MDAPNERATDLLNRLSKIERLLVDGKQRTLIRAGLRDNLRDIFLLLRETEGVQNPELRRRFSRLHLRTESARSTQDLRTVVAEMRQFVQSRDSLTKTYELETRLRELEGQIKTSARVVAEESPPETDVVTFDSLKGKRLLFAIMPFARDFDDVWTGGIKRAATGTGLTPIRIDMITQSSEITDDIVKVINASEIVVVDVTGNNPNVMWEFGYAVALKRRHAVISQTTESLTFDIKNLRTIIYKNTWQGVETLHKDLQQFIKGTIGVSKSKSKSRKK